MQDGGGDGGDDGRIYWRYSRKKELAAVAHTEKRRKQQESKSTPK